VVSTTLKRPDDETFLTVGEVVCAIRDDRVIGEAIDSRLTRGASDTVAAPVARRVSTDRAIGCETDSRLTRGADIEPRSANLSARVNELLPDDSPLLTDGEFIRSKRADGALLIRLELEFSLREKPDDERA
jgi:hypothetical protein